MYRKILAMTKFGTTWSDNKNEFKITFAKIP